MPQEEKHGTRSLTYSAWHRSKSICRFVTEETALTLAMIDVDHVLYCEYDNESKEPIALIEEAKDIGQEVKAGTVTQALARRAGLPALVVLWKEDARHLNPADENWPDLLSLRVKRLWPVPESQWKKLTPQEWADCLVRMRTWQADKLDELIFGKRST